MIFRDNFKQRRPSPGPFGVVLRCSYGHFISNAMPLLHQMQRFNSPQTPKSHRCLGLPPTTALTAPAVGPARSSRVHTCMTTALFCVLSILCIPIPYHASFVAPHVHNGFFSWLLSARPTRRPTPRPQEWSATIQAKRASSSGQETSATALVYDHSIRSRQEDFERLGRMHESDVGANKSVEQVGDKSTDILAGVV